MHKMHAASLAALVRMAERLGMDHSKAAANAQKDLRASQTVKRRGNKS
jgi:hypothetical protein